MTLHAGRRARAIVPSLGARAAVVAAAAPAAGAIEDVRLFATALAGGLVFFGTFFS